MSTFTEVSGLNAGNDYVGHSGFPPPIPALEPLESIKERSEAWAGPTSESNWVIPGRLLVGAFPATPDDSETTGLLYSILAQGVGTFVCLQEEFMLRGVPEQLWRSGQALRPYFRDVVEISRRVEAVRMTKPWVAPQVVPADSLAFLHYPIRDLGVGEDEGILRLALDLCDRIRRAETIYMHCWGGHGRTGTVVSVMLSILYGLSAEEAMARCQAVHDLRRVRIVVRSPQTQTQRDQVARLVYRWQEATLEADGENLMRIDSSEGSSLMRVSNDVPSPVKLGDGMHPQHGQQEGLANGYGLGSPRAMIGATNNGGFPLMVEAESILGTNGGFP